MKKIKKTVFNPNLKKPDSVTVEIFDENENKTISKTFAYPTENKKVSQWIKSIWEKQEFFCYPARVYFNIGWDDDHILYCEYTVIN